MRAPAVAIAFTLAVALPARAATTGALPGVERWRHALRGPLVAQPSVSPGGRIAVQTGQGLQLLRADGTVEAELAEARPAQPMWGGETVWFRADDGWRTWSPEGAAGACAVLAPSGALDAAGRAVFAREGELVACGPEKKALFPRHGSEAQVWPLADGWLTADDWYLESFTAAGATRGGGLVTSLGFPAGPGVGAQMLVVTPSGALAALDVAARLRWRGAQGVDGPPVTTRSGALVLLADHAVTLADPPLVSWSLPVLAGARAAAALDDGSVAVLERTGQLGLVREGRVVWSRRLDGPGNILAAHPDGLLLVQDAGALVAVTAPPPDAGARYPVALGLDRSARPAVALLRARCPAPGPGRVSKGTLHVDGFAPARDGTCRFPALETPVTKVAGKEAFRTPCGDGCRVGSGGGRVVVADASGRLDELDGSGRRHALRRAGPVLAAVGVDEMHVWTLAADKLGSAAAVGRAVPFDGTLAGVDVNGRLWLGDDGREVKRFELVRSGAASSTSVAAFGATVCAQGPGRAGCWSQGQLLPALPLTPRVTWFGERAAPCADPTVLCLSSDGTTTEPLWHAAGPIDALVSLGDGSVAVLAAGRVTALWPDGSVRWALALAPEPCAGEAWLAPVSVGLLVARGCGVLAGIRTGARGKGVAER